MTAPYLVQTLPHTRLTALLNAARIEGPLTVTPPLYEQSHGFRASKLAGCLRQTGYSLNGAAQTHDTYDPDWTLSADIGTTIHTRLQEQLAATGLAVVLHGAPAIEVGLAEATLPDLVAERELLRFSGHIDAVIRTAQGRLSVLDIKTGDPKEFAPSYRWLADKQQKWAVQVSSYLYYFAMPDGEQAREAYILHVNRGNTKERNLFRIPWQPERWAVDLVRLKDAVDAVAGNCLPRPEPGACRFCAHRGLCEANTYREPLAVPA